MRKVVAVSLVFFFPVTLFLVGCASTVQENPRTVSGAAIGAVLGAGAGALIGSVTGSAGKGALIGGLVGLLAGGLMGQYYDQQARSRSATVAQYNYAPSQGTMVRIESVGVTPRTVRPGETVNLNMTYAVVAPNPNVPVKVHETREILYNSTLVGNPTVVFDRPQGTWASTLPITIPASSPVGNYTVTMRVQADSVSDAISTSFTVRR